MIRSASLGLVLAVALAPDLALAHTGVGQASGFVHGVAHPIAGLDHVLAMVMVGLLGWQLGGRALWLVPASFVLMMVLGGLLGVAGMPVPFVELGIAASVVVLGAVLALAIRPPVAAAMGVVALFAIFHGHAHGAEMPGSAGALVYGLGFTSATLLLHAAGIGLGHLIGRAGSRHAPAVVRSAGGLAALAGIAILAGLV